MRAKLTLLSALALGTFTGAIAAGCQTYDFEPVEPLAIAQTTVEETITARNRKPNIMLLVDTSGSMTDPVDPSDSDCNVSQGGVIYPCGGEVPCPTARCPTRWTELQAAVPQFLESSGPYVRFGLTTYPDGNEPNTSIACGAATTNSVRQDLPQAEDDASLLTHARAINGIIQGIPNFGPGQPVGGTPTSGSLNFVSNLAGLQSTDREDFVILLTDGLPNCNKANEATGSDEAACKCTLQPGQCSGSYERRGCLDMDESVKAVKALKERDITTIVIGFGAETADPTRSGPAVLGAMARAGGFARTCEANQTSCGEGDPCDPVTRLCSRSFYQAGNQAELAQALEAISKKVVNTEPCLIKLDPAQMPSDPKLIVVYIDGQRTTAGDGTWTLEERGVLFNGATCERIMASTPDAPVGIEIRAIRQR